MPDFMMKQRSIPMDDSWDVIVVGGGPAGCAAATSSAREGARTLLVEAAGALGGMGTLGLVPWFCGYHDRKQVIARGLAERVRLALADGMPHLREWIDDNPLADPAIDPELLKRVYDDMVAEHGATVLYHTQLSAVETAGDGDIDALVVAGKDGLRAYRAAVYVDCTGDGDLAAWAGAEIEKGDADGGMQPGTACFVIANIDEEVLWKGPRIHFYDPNSPIHQALKDDKYPDIIDVHTCNIKIGPGTFGFNTGHVYDVDNTDPESVSEALPHGRRMAAQYRDAFAEYHPAFANSFLAATGARLGVRETRRVVGDYYLTLDDYLARASFPDEICRNAYNIDVWRLSDGGHERTLSGHVGAVIDVATAPDGRHLVSAGFDSTIRIWRLGDGALVRTLRGHSWAVNCVVVTPDGERIVSGSRDSTIRVWDFPDGSMLSTTRAHDGSALRISVASDQRFIVSAGRDGRVNVWDSEGSKELRATQGHEGRIGAMVLLSDGRRLVTGGADGKLKAWRIGEYWNSTQLDLTATLQEDGRPLSCVTATPDGKYIISGSDDGTIRAWGVP